MRNNTQAFWKDRLTKTTHKMPVPPTAVFHGEVPVVPELEPKPKTIDTPSNAPDYDYFFRVFLTALGLPEKLVDEEVERMKK